MVSYPCTSKFAVDNDIFRETENDTISPLIILAFLFFFGKVEWEVRLARTFLLTIAPWEERGRSGESGRKRRMMKKRRLIMDDEVGVQRCFCHARAGNCGYDAV
jgi:hypothetical protein